LSVLITDVCHNAQFEKCKTAQQLDTKVYNHTARILHVSAIFGHLQGRKGQRKTQHWLLCHRTAVAEFKKTIR